jgi:hypothetical protein
MFTSGLRLGLFTGLSGFLKAPYNPCNPLEAA